MGKDAVQKAYEAMEDENKVKRIPTREQLWNRLKGDTIFFENGFLVVYIAEDKL